MQHKARKCFGGFLALALIYLALSGISAHINSGSNESEKRENAQWVASSKNWIDKQLCNWMGVCGMFHLKQSRWTLPGLGDAFPRPVPDFSDFWQSGAEDPALWSDEEKDKREIPQYVWDYAPYVHLFSGESYWPGDLAEHLAHVSPYKNYTKIYGLHDMNLTNLHELNDVEGGIHGRFVYLQSNDNVEETPEWLLGEKNIPRHAEAEDDDDNEVDRPWPSVGDDLVSDQELVEQQAFDEQEQYTESSILDDWWSPELVPSTNGRCGGNSGFTCKGSKFGKCCSIYGWCGRGKAFCGEACDATAGRCKRLFEPEPRPRSDLRRRTISRQSIQHQPTPAGKSSAPAILIVVPKDDGIVDAFWFFFYSFNLGNTVFGVRFGNHVADWEHTLIRFKDGEPVAAFLSEHNFGDAYHWQALEKYVQSADGSGTMLGTWSNQTASRIAKRPVIYSAEGSHAMYAKPGLHPYVLPWGMLHDVTDRGPLWDPSLNVRSFTWDPAAGELRSSTHNPKAPVEWFHFAGHWGDKYYPLSDPRQYRIAGQYHYVNGPTGPKWKNLGRTKVCQGRRQCHIRNWAANGSRARRLTPIEEEVEEGGLPGGNWTDDGGACVR